MIGNVADELAEAVAAGLGMDEVPRPLPLALGEPPQPEVKVSPALSLFARPGDGSIRTRHVAILVAEGIDSVGARLGRVQSEDGDPLEVEVTMETMPSVLFDAVAVPGGDAAAKALGGLGHAAEFIVGAYRHCKPILALGAGRHFVENAGVPATLPSGDPDPGLLLFDDAQLKSALPAFVEAIAKHRHNAREMDPPPV
jgi:catalase